VKKEELEAKAALEVAKDTLRHTATADWHAEKEFMLASRGGQLTIHEVREKMGTVTARAFNVAVQQLMDLTMNHPEGKERRRAAEVLVKLHLAEVELKLKYLQAYTMVDSEGEVVKPVENKPVVLQELPALPPMTEEQLTDLIQARRARRAG
jgi:hypothetical protein